MELERERLERERMAIAQEKNQLEMDKLKFQLKQALANEEKAQKTLSSMAHVSKSTSSSSHSRNYSSSKEKRRSPPRAEIYRSSTSR
jgi:hypothetical protein